MAEKLPGRAGPVSSSSEVKVENPDWRAGVVERSKVIGEASDKASTSSLIKQSSSIKDFFWPRMDNLPTSLLATVGSRLAGRLVRIWDMNQSYSTMLPWTNPTLLLPEDLDSDEEMTTDEDLFLGLSHEMFSLPVDDLGCEATEMRFARQKGNCPHSVRLDSHDRAVSVYKSKTNQIPESCSSINSAMSMWYKKLISSTRKPSRDA